MPQEPNTIKWLTRNKTPTAYSIHTRSKMKIKISRLFIYEWRQRTRRSL